MRFPARFRRPLAAIVLLASAGAAAYWWWSGRTLNPQQMASYLPGGSGMTIYIDVNAIRRSGLLEKLAAAPSQEDAEYRKFVANSGFDYRKDLDSILLAYEGPRTYAVVNGRFSWDQLNRYVASNGGQCQDRFCRIPGSTPQRLISFHPLRRSTMALAVAPDDYAATNIVERKQGSLVVEPSTQPVWVAISPYFLQNNASYPSGLRLFALVLSSAQNVLLTLGPENQRLGLNLTAHFQTEPEAEVARAKFAELTTTIKNLILREKQTPNPKDLSGILTSGKFYVSANDLHGNWPVDPGFLESLTKEQGAK